MKKSVLVLLVSSALFAEGLTAQITSYGFKENPTMSYERNNLNFDISHLNTASIKIQQIKNAKSLSDFITDYPSAWIEDYLSTTVKVTTKGIVNSENGKGNLLNQQQIALLKTASLGSTVTVQINYLQTNSVTGKKDPHEMVTAMRINPENAAEFIGGNKLLREYFQEKVIDRIEKSHSDAKAIAVFTINENGGIGNFKFEKSSGNKEIDKIIIDAITSMPAWKPAENENRKVSDEFVFRLGMDGC